MCNIAANVRQQATHSVVVVVCVYHNSDTDIYAKGWRSLFHFHSCCRNGILQHLNSEQLRHIILEKDDAEALLLWASRYVIHVPVDTKMTEIPRVSN